MRYVFNEVAIKGVKRWQDPETGKPRQETRKFWQTINPFNKNAEGVPKTREEIMGELVDERADWLKTTPGNSGASGG